MEEKPKLKRLTIKQKKAFYYLMNYVSKYKSSPSIRYLRDLIDRDLSHIAILDRLKLLEKKKYVKRKDGKFKPTSEGIEQYISDLDKDNRVKRTKK